MRQKLIMILLIVAAVLLAAIIALFLLLRPVSLPATETATLTVQTVAGATMPPTASPTSPAA